MRLRNEIFANVLDWLIANKGVTDQQDLAMKTGISKNTVSRIMTGKVEPKDDTLRKLNAAFGGIFNMQYLRGESVIMLVEDLADGLSGKTNAVDEGSKFNAMLASKDETIAALQSRIEDLQNQIATKDDQIREMQSQISILISNLGQPVLKKFPYGIGAADTLRDIKK